MALASRANSVIYGGAAGGGKTEALKAKLARHIGRPGYAGLAFRQTSKQLRQPGGLWESCRELYLAAGGLPNETDLTWKFPGPSSITFGYIEHDRDLSNWKGAQAATIAFDQLEEFTWRQYTYLQSRNRSTCGVQPRLFSTCNPDPDSFLRWFLDWWIDEKTGYAIPERSGVLRYFAMDGDTPVWNDPDDLARRYGPDGIQSVTFIAAKLTDNVDLMRTDPQYLSRLKSLPRVERERLLHGNWNVRWSAGEIFQRAWFPIEEAAPATLADVVRYWDRAATVPSERNGHGSWTVGVKMAKDERGLFWVLDVDRFQGSPMAVQQRILNIASQDGRRCRIGIEQDPGQAGKAEADSHVRALAGYEVVVNAVREAKAKRATPYSAQCEAGNVRVVRGRWNEDYLRELENFDGSDRCASDQVDASSGAFYVLTSMQRGMPFVHSFGRGVTVG